MLIDVSEVTALAADLTAYADDVEDQARTVVAKIGHDTVTAIQGGILAADAIDTGASLNSTSVDFDDGGLGFEAGPTTDYFIFVDQGTSRIAPRDIVGPAVDPVFAQAEEAFGQVGEKVLGG